MTSKKAAVNSILVKALVAVFLVAPVVWLSASPSFAQSAEYTRHHNKRKKKVAKNSGSSSATQSAPGGQSDKLNMGDLEKKYWAPKDTDFSVVQNRKYTKAKRFALSLLAGPIVNDPYNTGYNYEMKLNYYFSERYGIEFFDDKADLSDSQTTKDFQSLSGGGVRPDFNRDVNFVGVGFNWVPFYAKMSFLGKKIIYFDMQFTPFIGVETYEQVVNDTMNDPQKNSFAYGFDVVQYFFFSKHFAVQADLQNRYFQQNIVSYGNGLALPGAPKSSNTANTTNFLMGVTYFF